nr:glutamate--tRNA ligase [Chloroflexota bacterium]
TYHLAVVVDDHDMRIDLIIRGEEWISSTPKHVLLYGWLGWELPRFVHLPLLRNENRSKVSKRRNPWATLPWFRENGYLPEALLNFLALLGWSMPDGREVFGLEDVVEHFSLDRMSLAGPIFNLEKLDWLNGHYIRALPLSDLAERVRPFLDRADVEVDAGPPLEVVLPLVQERLKRLTEAPELLRFFYERPGQLDPGLLVPKGMDPGATHAALVAAIERIRSSGEFTHEHLEAELRGLASERGLKTGQLFMLLRVGCTFSTVSPPLFETMAALGRDEVLDRLEAAEQALASLAS